MVASRHRGVKPVSVNTYIKALNAFCEWLHDEGHHAERLQLPLLKLEKRVLETLTDDQLKVLLTWKPKGFEQHRLHALIAVVLDPGVRVEEALTSRSQHSQAPDDRRCWALVSGLACGSIAPRYVVVPPALTTMSTTSGS